MSGLKGAGRGMVGGLGWWSGGTERELGLKMVAAERGWRSEEWRRLLLQCMAWIVTAYSPSIPPTLLFYLFTHLLASCSSSC